MAQCFPLYYCIVYTVPALGEEMPTQLRGLGEVPGQRGTAGLAPSSGSLEPGLSLCTPCLPPVSALASTCFPYSLGAVFLTALWPFLGYKPQLQESLACPDPLAHATLTWACCVSQRQGEVYTPKAGRLQNSCRGGRACALPSTRPACEEHLCAHPW